MTTTPVEQRDVAPGETLTAVRNLRPLIDEHRHQAHEQARMARPVLEACRKAGVFTMVSPREVGGADAGFPEVMSVFEELGYSDPTVAWHAGNSFALARNVVHLGPSERASVFGGEPGPFGFSAISGGIAHAVEGGYRLDGRGRSRRERPKAYRRGPRFARLHRAGCPIHRRTDLGQRISHAGNWQSRGCSQGRIRPGWTGSLHSGIWAQTAPKQVSSLAVRCGIAGYKRGHRSGDCAESGR
jgi:hypothetical protein